MTALGADALDFWLGNWNVTWVGDGRGTNSIRRICDGMVIEESFDAADDDDVLVGRSLSVRDASDGRWRQTWVDSNGSYLDFVGIDVDGRIGFQRETVVDGLPIIQRMVWLDVTTESLRWQWQRSADGGTPWSVVWEIHYQRA